MEQKSPDSKQIFVAMWFAPEMESIYREGILPGIEDAGKGYKAKKIDEKETINKICDEIIAEIRKSRAVVADFTGQRGGVYYEAGFAMGLGIPVIWTVREDFIDSLHFDTNHYSHIKYKTPEELRTKLTNRILALGI
jgi:nucleoside 2-deoxyribosyltransferase